MPGAARRKSGIFIFQPEHLIGHWVGEPKKMDAVQMYGSVGSVFVPLNSPFLYFFGLLYFVSLYKHEKITV